MDTTEQITIYADTRETNTSILPRLQELGVRIQVGELEIGDYVLSDDQVVERKAAAEFVASIMNGTLFNQAGKLRLKFARTLILIEGDIYSTGHAIARDSIDGALAFLITLNGFSVLQMKSPQASADIIYRLAKSSQSPDAEPSFRRGKVTQGRSEALFCIEGVLGVGPSLAVRILDHFKSVSAFFTASAEDLQQVSGIGPKRAERIHAITSWQQSELEAGLQHQSLFTDPAV